MRNLIYHQRSKYCPIFYNSNRTKYPGKKLAFLSVCPAHFFQQFQRKIFRKPKSTQWSKPASQLKCKFHEISGVLRDTFSEACEQEVLHAILFGGVIIGVAPEADASAGQDAHSSALLPNLSLLSSHSSSTHPTLGRDVGATLEVGLHSGHLPASQ